MKILKWFIYCLLIFFALLIGLFVICPLINNVALYAFSIQLYNLQLPSDMIVVEKRSICGKLNGNGDGMDYFVCMLVKTDDSIDSLRATFNINNFKPARIGSTHYVEFEIVPVYQAILESDNFTNRKLVFKSLQNEIEFSDYYAIILYDGGYSTFFDIRGG